MWVKRIPGFNAVSFMNAKFLPVHCPPRRIFFLLGIHVGGRAKARQNTGNFQNITLHSAGPKKPTNMGKHATNESVINKRGPI